MRLSLHCTRTLVKISLHRSCTHCPGARLTAMILWSVSQSDIQTGQVYSALLCACTQNTVHTYAHWQPFLQIHFARGSNGKADHHDLKKIISLFPGSRLSVWKHWLLTRDIKNYHRALQLNRSYNGMLLVQARNCRESVSDGSWNQIHWKDFNCLKDGLIFGLHDFFWNQGQALLRCISKCRSAEAAKRKKISVEDLQCKCVATNDASLYDINVVVAEVSLQNFPLRDAQPSVEKWLSGDTATRCTDTGTYPWGFATLAISFAHIKTGLRGIGLSRSSIPMHYDMLLRFRRTQFLRTSVFGSREFFRLGYQSKHHDPADFHLPYYFLLTQVDSFRRKASFDS